MPRNLKARAGVAAILSALLAGTSGAVAQDTETPQELRVHIRDVSWWEDGSDGVRWFSNTSAGDLFDTDATTVYQAIDLGPDAKGAGMTTFAECRGRASRPDLQTCAVRQAGIPYNSPFRTLVPPRRRFGVTALGQHRGALAVGQWRGASGDTSRVLLRRRGASHFATLAKRRRARRIDVGDGFVMYADKTVPRPGPAVREMPVVHVADVRGSKPRERRIAASTAAECSCPQGTVRIRDATLDGHHVYWIEEVARGPSSTTTRLLRVDLRSAQPAVEGVDAGAATTLAVTNGLVFHDAREEFERGYRPSWAPAEPFTPVG